MKAKRVEQGATALHLERLFSEVNPSPVPGFGMKELTYSFIGSLRAWLRENESAFQVCGIKVEAPADVLHFGTSAHFTSDRFEASFYVWEKRYWHLAMSDAEFADWRIVQRDPEYQIEYAHYEYARIDEMRGVPDTLRDRLVLLHQEN